MTLFTDGRVTTYHQLAGVDQELGGRFAKADVVAGAEPAVHYPAQPALSPWSGSADPGLEPPTGIDINALEPVGTPAEIARSLEALAGLPPGGSAGDLAEPADPAFPVVDRGSANSEERLVPLHRGFDSLNVT
jgi:hypothetical protein